MKGGSDYLKMSFPFMYINKNYNKYENIRNINRNDGHSLLVMSK